MTPLLENIPSELRSLQQWVCWRLEERDGRGTKVPYAPNGRRADASKPQTWTGFDEAIAACANGNHFNGIGFVFAEGGNVTGIDLDHHRDPAAVSK